MSVQSKTYIVVGTFMKINSSLFTLALFTVVMLGLSTGVSATGPGGWDHVGVGSTATTSSLNGAVYAMLPLPDSSQLIVGGAFTSAGGKSGTAYIALWNGTSWNALNNSNLNGAVRAIAYHNGKVYAGGNFTDAGGDSNADHLAVWDGSGWASFCGTSGPGFSGSVEALQIIGNTLYVGGSFQNGGGINAADYLVACDLTSGTPSATVLSDGDINGGIAALTADSNGVLYAGGDFINLAGIAAADHVAAFNGSTWHAMGLGLDSHVRALAAHGTDVYIGTDVINVAGIAQADHVAKWDGSNWSAVGANSAGTDGWFPAIAFIYGMTTLGSDLFVVGSFQNANGDLAADQVAYFDGTNWRSLGSDGVGNGPLNANSTAVAVFRLSLYAGGSFTSAGGDNFAEFIASYWLLRPDAQIASKVTGPFAGNNVYSAVAAGESKTVSIGRGKSSSLFVEIQNDGLFSDSFTVKGTGSARGYTVNYFNGATKVTQGVKAGTFSTGSVAPGQHLTLKVTVKRATASAKSVNYLVKASSPGTPPDAVKLTFKAK
jgi:hypothetical protein